MMMSRSIPGRRESQVIIRVPRSFLLIISSQNEQSRIEEFKEHHLTMGVPTLIEIFELILMYHKSNFLGHFQQLSIGREYARTIEMIML